MGLRLLGMRHETEGGCLSSLIDLEPNAGQKAGSALSAARTNMVAKTSGFHSAFYFYFCFLSHCRVSYFRIARPGGTAAPHSTDSNSDSEVATPQRHGHSVSPPPPLPPLRFERLDLEGPATGWIRRLWPAGSVDLLLLLRFEARIQAPESERSGSWACGAP